MTQIGGVYTGFKPVQQGGDVYVPMHVADGCLPFKQVHAGDIGWSVFSAEDVDVPPGVPTLVDTGVKVAVPSGYEVQIRPRSGLAAKLGITVLNTPGTIDRGYRGVIKVILFNTGAEVFHVQKGDAIAQAVVCPVPAFRFETVGTLPLPPDTRADGGFGSTGIRHE